MFGPIPTFDPLDPTMPIPPGIANANDPNLALLQWQERQRRQRTLRMLMMFLMVLLLMDGDEPVDRRHAAKHHLRQGALERERGRYGNFRMFVDENGDLLSSLTWDVWRKRRAEDEVVRRAVTDNEESRYRDLVKRNDGRDVEGELRDWAEKKVMEEVRLTLGLEENEFVGQNPAVERTRTNSDLNNGDVHVTRSLLSEKPSSAATIDADLSLEDDAPVFHYPRNATGYYRGLWVRVPPSNISKDVGSESTVENAALKQSNTAGPKVVTVQEIYPWVQKQLKKKNNDVSLLILPPDMYLDSDDKFKNSTNNTAPLGKDTDDYWQGLFSSTENRVATSSLHNKTPGQNEVSSKLTPSLSLTKDAGRAAFQLYSRPIPAMTELSIVDGLVKLYDGMTTSFVSRRTDVLLRVRGVIVHGIGKISLVSSSTTADGAFEERKRTVLGVRRVETAENRVRTNGNLSAEMENIPDQVEEENVEEITDRIRHRRLHDLLNGFLTRPGATENLQHDPKRSRGLLDDESTMLSQIRDDAMELYFSDYANQILPLESMKQNGWTLLKSIDEEDVIEFDPKYQGSSVRHGRALQSIDSHVPDGLLTGQSVDPSQTIHSNLDATVDGSILHRSTASTEEKELRNINRKIPGNEPSEGSQYVYPFPYVCDDANDSIKKSSSPASRRLPTRELALEANAADCEFEINIDVHETTLTFSEWRNALIQRLRTVQAFNPYLKTFDRDTEWLKRSQILMIKSQVGFIEEDSVKEALVLSMSGNIESSNCNFHSFVNVTAIRTNWEHTTAKAINYSFYMMLTCLMQIVVLLRQLLHTQAQSAASNVSLVCIGWQTVLDAILCIAHIFLCLVMQPLFTAFASVAFFKLLIFCVIEMKYMALIIQARNNTNNPTNSQDDVRRQITLLHLRFYAALMVAIMSFWYIGQTQRTVYILLLYSFWVPQIILNVVTEARKPMHHYYVYGMSTTRLIAPLYVFAVQKNFLKEVNPDFPSDPKMCQILVLWVFIQTAILVGQTKYGTRFMIPQRFLPPKFDYHRPIPTSLLPPSLRAPTPSNGSPSAEIELGPLLNGESSPQGARHRRARLGSRVEESNNGTTMMSTDASDAQTLDCVICYNEIDVNDRSGYMLAPCLHIFHSTCLEQWMEVKMECPICRCNLPAL
eukprot:CCRYP_002790-RA/>CCRYP_002790-RA protein AED:0.01 eAED:0.01 QI:255/1/1/1/0.66/0.5/4/203/1156